MPECFGLENSPGIETARAIGANYTRLDQRVKHRLRPRLRLLEPKVG